MFNVDEYIINIGKPINKPELPKNQIYYTFIATFPRTVSPLGVNGKIRVNPEILVQPMLNGKPTKRNMKWANEHIDELIKSKYFVVEDETIATMHGNLLTARQEGETTIYLIINDSVAGKFGLHVENDVHFNDPYVEKIALRNWDKNCDGVVTMSELEHTTMTMLPFELFVNSSVTEFNEFDYMKSVTSIESYSFSTCKNLHEITIPENVTYIGNYAFEMCESLTEIHINSTNVPDIGENIFDECPNLEVIYVPAEMFDLYYENEKWKQYITYINNTGFDYTLNFVLS